jgi:hypothetical protein
MPVLIRFQAGFQGTVDSNIMPLGVAIMNTLEKICTKLFLPLPHLNTGKSMR